MNVTTTARTPTRRDYLLLSLAVAASAVPLVVLGQHELLGYDAVWHVFIARQDVWHNLWAEIRNTAHPPLFFLGLRAVVAILGAHPFVYRLISIAATLGSAWMVGRIVQKTTGRPWLPAVAALAFGTSVTAASVGLDVRAYALATFFMLWAFLSFLELAGHAFSAPDHRARVVFALMTSLALATHYGTSIFLLGCFAAAVAPAVFDREYRRRLFAGVRHRWRANLLSFGTPAAVLAIAYGVHIVTWSRRPFRHLVPFLFDPGREGALEFVWRNTRALFGLFVPRLDYPPIESTLDFRGPELPVAAVGVLLAVCLAAVAWLGFRPLRTDGGDSIARRIPAILLVVMTALVIGLALLGRYPYGGRLRQQFFLFPFAVIALTLLIDEGRPQVSPPDRDADRLPVRPRQRAQRGELAAPVSGRRGRPPPGPDGALPRAVPRTADDLRRPVQPDPSVQAV